MALAFALGALVFFAADWLVDHRGGAKRKAVAQNQAAGSGAAIFVGTLLDNIPEGVAGSINLEAAGYSRARILRLWVMLVVLSAACAGLGYLMTQWLPGADGRRAQAFAAGAMLTMLADAMMPEAYEHGGTLVGLCTVTGFLLAAVLAVIQ